MVFKSIDEYRNYKNVEDPNISRFIQITLSYHNSKHTTYTLIN